MIFVVLLAQELDTKKVKESSFRAAPQLQLIHDVEASSSEGEVKPFSCKRRAQNEVFTPQVHLRDKRKEPVSKKSCLRVEKSEHPQPEFKSKKLISCQFSRKQILNSKRSSVICLSNQNSNVHLDPKNKELTSGYAQLEVPISGIQPNDSSPVRNEGISSPL